MRGGWLMVLALFPAAASVAEAQLARQDLTVPTVSRTAGARLEVITFSPRQGARPAGELITVSADSLWLLADSTLVGLALRDVSGVRVRRHKSGMGTMLTWGLVGGLASGGALAGACSTVADNCGGILGGTTLAWLIVGGLAGISLESSQYRTIREASVQALRPYARFPQGWPEGVDRAALRGARQ